ncbi:RNA helicase [Pleurotus pulmonarius]|nr:RNA helicase [Pleurotus pulmonarius]
MKFLKCVGAKNAKTSDTKTISRSSRTRLSKDLRPNSKNGVYQVARDRDESRPQYKSEASRPSRLRFTKDSRPDSHEHTQQAAKERYQERHQSKPDALRPRQFDRDALPHVGRVIQKEGERETNRQSRPRTRERTREPIPKPRDKYGFNWDVDLEQRRQRADHKEDASSQKVKADPLQKDLPTEFTSPPLMPGILSCLEDAIGTNARPTPIQSLSLKWLLEDSAQQTSSPATTSNYKQFLLASETGSGKSIAYLLPVLQALKLSEAQFRAVHSGEEELPLNPRALVLAPTHELSRQLSTFAKALIHDVKLRILCASRANTRNGRPTSATASKMTDEGKGALEPSDAASSEVQVQAPKTSWPVDMVVGTPNKVLDMVRGRGWDREEQVEEEENELWESEDEKPLPRGVERYGRGAPEMGLANVEWVVIDEADVLMDPDFQETTLKILSDISAARGHPIAPVDEDANSTVPAVEYPFNLVLTSATIPSALATYLDTHLPKLVRLVSPGVHHLPKTLQTEFSAWTGGNKYADIEHRIRRVWAEDATTGGIGGKRSNPLGENGRLLSKILVFCNQNTKVDALSEYLLSKGIKTVALTSQGSERKKGSNHHLDGFLRGPGNKDSSKNTALVSSDPAQTPHVMITTSLLSRGLDFSPDMRHIFIVDEPRNMVDFLHRAGRSGRAGERGKVVIFGKMKGRGSSKAKDVRQRVKALN